MEYPPLNMSHDGSSLPPIPLTPATAVRQPMHHQPSHPPVQHRYKLTPANSTVPEIHPHEGEDAGSFLFRSMFSDNVEPPDPKQGSCPQCGKWLSKRKMAQHMRTHSAEKHHKCESCERAFNRVEHLQRHRLIHTGEKPHRCDVCDKRFGRNDHLRTHMRIHTGEKPHKCEECGKLFMRSDHKMKHMQSHARKDFVC